MSAIPGRGGEVGRRPKPWRLWAGYTLTAVPILVLLLSASMKISRRPQVIDVFVGKLGYPPGALLGIALLVERAPPQSPRA